MNFRITHYMYDRCLRVKLKPIRPNDIVEINVGGEVIATSCASFGQNQAQTRNYKGKGGTFTCVLLDNQFVSIILLLLFFLSLCLIWFRASRSQAGRDSIL